MANNKGKIIPSLNGVEVVPNSESSSTKIYNVPDKKTTSGPIYNIPETTKPEPKISESTQTPAAQKGTQTAPKITPTKVTQPQVGATVADNKATIWNPNTGEKKVINKGDAMPTGFSLWTGGTATGKEAQEAIKNKLPFGMSKEQMDAQDQEMKKSTDMAADALEGDLVDEETLPEEEDKTTEETGTDNEIKTILDSLGIEKLEVSDYTEDYAKLEEWKTNQLENVELKYERKINEQEKKNERALAALKANMIKKGIPLDGTSYMSATGRQEERNQEYINDLNREMAIEQNAIEQGYLDNTTKTMQAEREEKINATITDINNLYQGYNLATNIWSAFNSRSEAERSSEQQAQEHLDNMVLKWATLDEKERASSMSMTQDFIEKGLYDMSNKETVKMLSDIEKNNSMEVGELVYPAGNSYVDRINNLLYKDFETQKLISDIDRQETLLPYEVAKYEADIAKSTAAAQKSLSSNLGESSANMANSYLEQIKINLFGGEFKDGKFEQYSDEQGNPLPSYLGEDMKLDTQKYNTAMNSFVGEMDPDLKNEAYYKDIFMNYIPPTAFLNEDDSTASTLIQEYKKRGESFF